MTLLLPVCGFIGLYYGMGGRIDGLVLGVVSDEVLSHQECFNSSLKTFEIQGFDCVLSKTSCRFIEDFDQTVAELVSFISSYSFRQ